MKNTALYLLITLIVLSVGACVATGPSKGVVQGGNLATLETSALRMTITKSPAPYILRLVHRASGTVLVSEPSERTLFALFLAKEGGQDYIDSSAARKGSIEVAPAGEDSEIILTFSRFPNLDLTVVVRGTFSDQEPLTVWTIEVRNNTGRKIERVRFPLIRAVRSIGDGGDDSMVFPYLPGTLIRRPWQAWSADYGVWLRYPGELSAQFITYQDPSAGIYLASQDPAGREKGLAIWKRPDGFNLCHDFFPAADTGAEWKSPYPVAIGVTGGSWCDSADIYKEWSMTQPWCAQTLAQRDDVPDWWRKGPLVYTCSMRTYDGRGNQKGSYYPRLPETLRYLKDRTDGQIVAMLADWENHRRWTAGDYFPVFDEKNAQKTIAQIKADGFRPFFYLSGPYYTFENEGLDPAKIPIPGAYVPSFVVDGATGKPQVLTIDDSSLPGPWKRHSHAFCVNEPATRRFFRSVVDETSRLGVTMLQMDQTTSGAGLPCWSRQHDHVPGIGLYQTQGFQGLLKDMRDYGKSKDPDFVLFNEEPHEQLIPFLDGFHTREYYEQQWYRSFDGAVGIPLFTYLYHEYAVCYGGDSANIGPRGIPNIPWYVRNLAVNLVTGKTPGAATWFNPDQLFNADPRALEMIRNHRRLLRAGASPYLMEGRMLHPFELDARSVSYSITRWNQGTEERAVFSEPSVLTSSWEAPDGGVGHLFVNASNTGQPLEVSVDTRNAPAMDSCDVRLYRSYEGDRLRTLWQAVALPRTFQALLSPREVLFLEVRAAGQ